MADELAQVAGASAVQRGMSKLTDTQRMQANAQLARYGYSVARDGRFVRPDGKHVDVTLTARAVQTQRGQECQFTASMRTGGKLWSGADASSFITGFWFAKPLELPE